MTQQDPDAGGAAIEEAQETVSPEVRAAHSKLVARLTRTEIEATMADCDAMGPEAFLRSQGFFRPRNWVKRAPNGQLYPAKATVAIALGKLPEGVALSAKTFFGGYGEAQANARLRALGYEIVTRDGEAGVTRAAVEAAMDAFDAWRQTGAKDEIFGAFGEPRDYWVRSTRARENRVYPTKPIVGYLLGKTELTGGWGQSHNPAALLHNAGFIIVDAEDRPTAPPERYDHLIRDAERIRLCARNYHIDPARERGAAEVSIRSGDLAREMGLENAFPTICDALGGVKFQTLCALPPPRFTTPNPSSTTTFTYALAADGITPTMTAPDQAPVPPTNLILYGPPGTGKTYATAWEAVKLCLGAEADPLRDDRKALMAEYKRLCDEGRIEFTTFHQSMSYEDFVEGLRPETEEGEGAAEGGFRLEARDGLFRRVSLRAEASRAPATSALTLDGRQVFKMSIGNSMLAEDIPLFDDAIAGGYAVFGFADIDWSDHRFADRVAILEAMTAANYETGGTRTAAAQMTDIFRNRISIGDVIVVTKGNKLVRAIGVVTGDYTFAPRPEGDYAHRRAVDWLWYDRDGLPASEFYNRQISQRTLYPLALEDINQPALLRLLNASQDVDMGIPEAFVLIIDEINRANISKVFGELITLLEPDKRLGAANEIRLRLPYSGRNFGVPANLHIIGTMNTADRSIALLDTALRRRFTFRELMPDPEALRAAHAAAGRDAENIGGVNLCLLLKTLNARIEYLFDREHQIGHAYFTACTTRDELAEVMRFKIIPLLAEYFYEDWGKVAAVLGDGPGRPERFLRAVPLSPPPGLGEEDMGSERLRWQMLDTFDFADFAA